MNVRGIPTIQDPRRLQEAASANQAEAQNATSEVSGRSGVRADQTLLQAEAVSKQHEMIVAKAALDALPDVRAERLEAIRSKLASGEYDRPDALHSLADSISGAVAGGLLSSEGADEAASAPVPAASLEAIPGRLASGYYEQSSVQNVVANRIANQYRR